jgi:DNA-directed RNA polymerase subunit delta
VVVVVVTLQIQQYYYLSIVVDGFSTTIPSNTILTTRIVRGNIHGDPSSLSTTAAAAASSMIQLQQRRRRQRKPSSNNFLIASIKTFSRHHTILEPIVLYSSRRSQDDDNDNNDGDGGGDSQYNSSFYDDDKDSAGTPSQTRFVGGSREETELNSMKRMEYRTNISPRNRNDDPDYYYYNDEDSDDDDDDDDADVDDGNEKLSNNMTRRRSSSSSRRTIATRPSSDSIKPIRSRQFVDDDDDDDESHYDDDDLKYDDQYDDELEDYDDDDDDEPNAGNFWSNPAGGIGAIPSASSKRGPLTRPRMVQISRRVPPPSLRDDDDDDYDYNDDDDDGVRPRPRPRRPRSATTARRSPVRNSVPQPPRVIADFYDKFFWFGFDSNNSDEVGDKTIFGGTKGKFNGLAYLRASEDNERKKKPSSSSSSSSSTSSSRSRNDTSGYSGNPQTRGLPPARKATRTYNVEQQDVLEDDDYFDYDDDEPISNRRDDYYVDNDVDDDRGKLDPARSRRDILPYNYTPPKDSLVPRTADSKNRKSIDTGRSSRDLPPRRSSGSRRRPRPRPLRPITDWEDENEPSRSSSSNNGGSSSRSWVPKQVSSWFATGNLGGDRFGGDDDYDDDDDDDDNVDGDYDRRDRVRDSTRRRSERRQERRGGNRNSGSVQWSPLTILDSFLGIDREDMAYKADMYDSKMGVTRSNRYGNSSRQRQSQEQPQRRSARDYPGRSGYAYRYDNNDDNDGEDVVDLDPPPLDDDMDVSISSSQRRRKQSSSSSSSSGEDSREGEQRSTRRKEQTWEERAMAVERVPPASVAAWGPTGELPMTARMKAIVDALQDIATARRKLDSRIKREILARDEVTILKVDAERQRLKIEESQRGGSRSDMDQLRQMDLDIDVAARSLRRATTLVELARNELEEFEDRHWAVLSFYNPEQASVLVGEALNEFSVPFDPSPSSGGLGDEQANGSKSNGNAEASSTSPRDTNGASSDMGSS